ncbi:hypothetical protein JVX90_01760 [Gordonia sp. PDNC005]|uniref:hypothetical protein n=1 Tax=unclassified Gordonia (in: high G+C Gram-positive bacteria) TaxID=2657482 RepID=UPI001964E78F|nr:hypothetical protein [Gordonia sp. PDNC005]QRY63004.1 hypothetical protein JVX90_01760 [Gordonia sp. PDNC005]
MPVSKLDPLATFNVKGQPLRLTRNPASVTGGAMRYADFAEDCETAVRVLRRLDSSDLQGPEANAFRGKIYRRLAGWLTSTAAPIAVLTGVA